SFHVGGLCKNPNSFAATIITSRTVFDTARELGFHFTMLDIGGGFLGDNRSEGFFHKVRISPDIFHFEYKELYAVNYIWKNLQNTDL
ncbi:unnamed protein product, partial [Larinioides sclopetarius]